MIKTENIFTDKLMKYSILFFTLIVSLMLFISCSDLKEDISSTAPVVGVHKEGIIDTRSPDFHGNLIADANWDMKQCQQCHAADYSGGTAGASCYDCHTSPDGPEACNTCHGSFAFPTRIAPPRALNKSTETTYPGVGAHTNHLYENNLGKDITCVTCHTFPTSFYAESHIGVDNKAELNFGELAIHNGAAPSYSFADNKCSNSYCHGNFVFYRDSSAFAFVYTAATMEGNNASPKWNQVDGSQAACGTCHGLPPTGHVPAALNTCVNCHPGVVDNQGNIIDQTKHINGVKNVFGN